MRTLTALFGAIAIQPLVFLLRLVPVYLASTPGRLDSIGFLLFAVLFFATPVAILFGLPVFHLLRKLGRLSWKSAGISGFLIGASFHAVFAPPHRTRPTTDGHDFDDVYANTFGTDIPTAHARLADAADMLYFGIHGLAGALVFYALWNWMDRRLRP